MRCIHYVPRLTRQLWLLATAAFVNFLGFMVMPFLVLYLTQVKGFSVETAGILLTVFGFGNIAGAWTGGQLSDKVGSLNVLILSFVLSAACMAAVPFLSNPYFLGGLFCIMAVANGAFRPAYDAQVVQICTEDERPRAYAVYVVAINIGAGMAAAMGGHLYAFDPNLIFFFDAFTSLAAAALIFFFLKTGASSNLAEQSAAIETEPPVPPYRSPSFLIVCIAACALDIIGKQVSTTLPLYVTSAYDMGPQDFGTLLTVGYIFFAAAVLPVSTLVKANNQLRYAIAGTCIVAAGFAGLPVGASVTLLVLSYLLITVGQLFFYPAVMVLAMGHAGRSGASGRYMGFYRTMQAVAGVGAPTIGTFMYVSMGPTTLWLTCAATAILTAMLLAAERFLIAPNPTGATPRSSKT